MQFTHLFVQLYLRPDDENYRNLNIRTCLLKTGGRRSSKREPLQHWSQAPCLFFKSNNYICSGVNILSTGTCIPQKYQILLESPLLYSHQFPWLSTTLQNFYLHYPCHIFMLSFCAQQWFWTGKEMSDWWFWVQIWMIWYIILHLFPKNPELFGCRVFLPPSH